MIQARRGHKDILVGMKNAYKDNLPEIGYSLRRTATNGGPTVEIGQLHVKHNFLVVDSLVAPAILGIDFLQKHGLTSDFTVTPVAVYQHGSELYNTEASQEVKLVWEAECQARKKSPSVTI